MAQIVQLYKDKAKTKPITPFVDGNAILFNNQAVFPSLSIGSANKPIYLNNGVLTAGVEVYSKTEVNDLLKAVPQYVTSQVIHSGWSGNELVSKTYVLVAYQRDLISTVFDGLSTPSGYHRAYRLTFQGTTKANSKITLYLNNIATSSFGTWSDDNFRIIGGTNLFTDADIILTTTPGGYSGSGTNLYYSITGASGRWSIYNVTIHGYFVKD